MVIIMDLQLAYSLTPTTAHTVSQSIVDGHVDDMGPPVVARGSMSPHQPALPPPNVQLRPALDSMAKPS